MPSSAPLARHQAAVVDVRERAMRLQELPRDFQRAATGVRVRLHEVVQSVVQIAIVSEKACLCEHIADRH